MRGFTLIELLVVIGIMSIVAGFVMSTYVEVRKAGEPSRAGAIYANALREAQLRALNMQEDTSWGLTVTDNRVIVFSGSTYSGRVVARDKSYQLPHGVTITGPTNILFAKFTGLSSNISTTTFANAYASSSVFITSGGGINTSL